MKSVSELKKEKLLIRNSDPLRATVIEMILDGALKAAKEESREANDADLLASLKRFIKQSEGAIELIHSKGGDAIKQENEVAMAKQFLPPSLTDEELRKIIEHFMKGFEPIKKNMGAVMKGIKSEYPTADMTNVSRLLGAILK